MIDKFLQILAVHIFYMHISTVHIIMWILWKPFIFTEWIKDKAQWQEKQKETVFRGGKMSS